jgi:hypothetical protein
MDHTHIVHLGNFAYDSTKDANPLMERDSCVVLEAAIHENGGVDLLPLLELIQAFHPATKGNQSIQNRFPGSFVNNHPG